MSDTIDLVKGGRINLVKVVDRLTQIRTTIGWEMNSSDTGEDFDIDVTAFLLNNNKKCRNVKDVIFYGNLMSPNESVVHSPDNTTGGSEEVLEFIDVFFEKMDATVTEISIIASIYDAIERKQNFGQIENSTICIYDMSSGTPKLIVRYKMDEDFSTETSVQVGSFYKDENNEWCFKAIGAGYKVGLSAYIEKYGLAVSEGKSKSL